MLIKSPSDFEKFKTMYGIVYRREEKKQFVDIMRNATPFPLVPLLRT